MSRCEHSDVLADVEAFCAEVRPIEELCYVEHRYNDQAIPLAKKYSLFGMRMPREYGGRGAEIGRAHV